MFLCYTKPRSDRKGRREMSVRISEGTAMRWRVVNGQDHATFFVETGRHEGLAGYRDGDVWINLSIVSTLGSFENYWANCGQGDWRSFLAGLSRDYAMSKLMGKDYKVQCADRTIADAKKDILTRRRDGCISQTDARAAWNVCEMFAGDDVEEIVTAFASVRIWTDSYWEMVRHRPAPVAVKFWERLWRPWADALKSASERPGRVVAMADAQR